MQDAVKILEGVKQQALDMRSNKASEQNQIDVLHKGIQDALASLSSPVQGGGQGSAPSLDLECYEFPNQIEIFQDRVLVAAVIPKGRASLDKRLKAEIIARLNATAGGEEGDGPSPGAREASPLVWSREKPKVEGWYFSRFVGDPNPTRWLTFRYSDMADVGPYDREYAGPIPEPEGPKGYGEGASPEPSPTPVTPDIPGDGLTPAGRVG